LKLDVNASHAALAGVRSLRQVLRAGLLGACAAVTCAQAAPAAPENLIDKKAPDFALTDLSGQSLTLARFRGKVVLLNFWATWCAPCQIEMPVFVAWQQQYGPQGFQIIGISMDDGAAPVQRLVSRLKLNYPVAMGDERLGARYGDVLGLPLTFLIDRKGIVRAQFQGEGDLKLIERHVTALLTRP
jgi:peroxiredoxin